MDAHDPGLLLTSSLNVLEPASLALMDPGIQDAGQTGVPSGASLTPLLEPIALSEPAQSLINPLSLNFGTATLLANTDSQTWNLDVDGNGEVGALSDGIMAVRFMFGAAFPGDALTAGAISPNATRNTSEIRAYLQQGVDQGFLDVDGNGEVGALSDGIMAVRFMFGAAFPGDALTAGAISPNATRNTSEIRTYLEELTDLTTTPPAPTITIATPDEDSIFTQGEAYTLTWTDNIILVRM